MSRSLVARWLLLTPLTLSACGEPGALPLPGNTERPSSVADAGPDAAETREEAAPDAGWPAVDAGLACADCAGPFGRLESPYRPTQAPTRPDRPTPGQATVDNGFLYRAVSASKRHQYSNVAAFNADDTLLLLSGSYGDLLDTSTLTKLRTVDGNGLDLHRAWLNRPEHRTKLFAVDGHAAYLLDALTDERELLHDFRDEYERIEFGPGEGSVSHDDRRVALVGKRGSDAHVLAFDLQTKSVVFETVLSGRFPGDEPTFDYALISARGEYVVVNTRDKRAQGGLVRFPIAGGPGLELTDLGKHSDVCVNQAGEEVVVSLTRPPRAYRLADGAAQELPTLDARWGGHVSCRNTGRPGWAYVSRHDTQEVLALKLDGSRTVERFGWHFSTEHEYRAEAHASVAHDGRSVLFASDWGVESNDNVSYLVQLAP